MIIHFTDLTSTNYVPPMPVYDFQAVNPSV